MYGVWTYLMSKWEKEDEIHARLREVTHELRSLREELRGDLNRPSQTSTMRPRHPPDAAGAPSAEKPPPNVDAKDYPEQPE